MSELKSWQKSVLWGSAGLALIDGLSGDIITQPDRIHEYNGDGRPAEVRDVPDEVAERLNRPLDSEDPIHTFVLATRDLPKQDKDEKADSNTDKGSENGTGVDDEYNNGIC